MRVTVGSRRDRAARGGVCQVSREGGLKNVFRLVRGFLKKLRKALTSLSYKGRSFPSLEHWSYFPWHEDMLSELHPVDDSPRPGDEREGPGDGVSLFLRDQSSLLDSPPKLFASSASWLEDSFEVDATDGLLGSFTCALKRGILLQGRLFVVVGERGGPRLLFHSSLFRRVTTLEVRLADVRAVEKKNSPGALSALRVSNGEGEALVFCSLIYRENAYRCVHEAWRRAVRWKPRTPRCARLEPSPTSQPFQGEPPQPLSDRTETAPKKSRRRHSEPPFDFAESSPRAVSFHPEKDDARRILRVEFPDHDPEVVYHALFDPAGVLLKRHLGENCGATAISMTARLAPGGSRSKSLASARGSSACERFISYHAPTSYRFPKMPKRCEVRDFQEYRVDRFRVDRFHSASAEATEAASEPSSTFSMRSAAEMRGAPFAQCFAVESLVRVRSRCHARSVATAATATSGAVVEVFCDIDWKHPVNGFVKGLIVKGAKDALRASYAKMLAMCAGDLERKSPSELVNITRDGARSFMRRRQTPSMDSTSGGTFGEGFEAPGPRTLSAATADARTVAAADREPSSLAEPSSLKADDACLKAFADHTWMIIPTVILLVSAATIAIYLFSFWTARETRVSGTGVSDPGNPRRVLFQAPGFLGNAPRERNAEDVVTRDGVRAALRSASHDDALIDSIARFLNEAHA